SSRRSPIPPPATAEVSSPTRSPHTRRRTRSSPYGCWPSVAGISGFEGLPPPRDAAHHRAHVLPNLIALRYEPVIIDPVSTYAVFEGCLLHVCERGEHLPPQVFPRCAKVYLRREAAASAGRTPASVAHRRTKPSLRLHRTQTRVSVLSSRSSRRW